MPESAALHQPHGSFNPTLEPNDQMPQSYDQKAIDVPPLAPLNAIPGVTDLIEGLHRPLFYCGSPKRPGRVERTWGAQRLTYLIGSMGV